VKFSVCPSILLNSREHSPLGVNEGVEISPRGQISPLGAKFAPRDEIIPWGPGVKLRMVLSFFSLPRVAAILNLKICGRLKIKSVFEKA
jgi:hypothetical protein